MEDLIQLLDLNAKIKKEVTNGHLLNNFISRNALEFIPSFPTIHFTLFRVIFVSDIANKSQI